MIKSIWKKKIEVRIDPSSAHPNNSIFIQVYHSNFLEHNYPQTIYLISISKNIHITY